MVPLYALVMIGLAACKTVLARQAARTERRYARAAGSAEALARAAQVRPGNGAAADPFVTAKRQYELGRVVDARDRLEATFLGRQARADRVGAALDRLRRVQGRAVPYLLGVADVALVLGALYALGVSSDKTAEAVRAWAGAVRM